MPVWLVVEIAVLGTMIVLAIVGNIGMCWVTYNTRNNEPITAMLMINMAATDLLRVILDMPFAFITLVSGDINQWLLGDIVCQITAFISQLLCLASTLSVACVSVDRYCTIVHTLDYSVVMTTLRAKIMLASSWCVAVIFSLLPILGVGLYRFLPATHHCTVDWTYSPVYSCCVLIAGFLAPLAVVSVSNYYIFRAARSQSRRVDDQSSRAPGTGGSGSTVGDGGRVRTGRRRVRYAASRPAWRPPRHRAHAARIILVVFGTFFFCWTAYAVANIWTVAHFLKEARSGWYAARGDWPMMNDPYAIGRWWITTVTFLAFGNAVLSPYVHTMLNRRMRKTMRKLLMRLCLPAGRVDYRRSTIVFAINAKNAGHSGRHRATNRHVYGDGNLENDALQECDAASGSSCSRTACQEAPFFVHLHRLTSESVEMTACPGAPCESLPSTSMACSEQSQASTSHKAEAKLSRSRRKNEVHNMPGGGAPIIHLPPRLCFDDPSSDMESDGLTGRMGTKQSLPPLSTRGRMSPGGPTSSLTQGKKRGPSTAWTREGKNETRDEWGKTGGSHRLAPLTRRLRRAAEQNTSSREDPPSDQATEKQGRAIETSTNTTTSVKFRTRRSHRSRKISSTARIDGSQEVESIEIYEEESTLRESTSSEDCNVELTVSSQTSDQASDNP